MSPGAQRCAVSMGTDREHSAESCLEFNRHAVRAPAISLYYCAQLFVISPHCSADCTDLRPTMIHSPGELRDSEKGTETQPLLEPLPLDLQGPPVIIQDRPRNARRRRFWHLLLCTFSVFGGLCFLLLKIRQRPDSSHTVRPHVSVEPFLY